MELVLSLQECLNLICTSGADKTYGIEGPIGSGKSSLVNMARAQYGEKYNYVHVDCTQLDVGDFSIPAPDKEAMVTRFLPNVLFVGDGVKPMFINFDEFGKASRSVQNACLPVLLERRVGMRKLPAGSIVYFTTNLGAEGVGDIMQAHALNRVSLLQSRSPTNKEWINWMSENFPNAPDSMITWAHENPQLFFSFKNYEKNPEDNPYIYNPKVQRRSFVTCRSLTLAAYELIPERRKAVGSHTATVAAIAGNIGVRAAMDLMAFVELDGKMPTWESIINTPESAMVYTSSPAAIVHTAVKCANRVTKQTLDACMVYIQRLPKEVQRLFVSVAMDISSKQAFLVMNQKFTNWCVDNQWMLGPGR